MVRVVEFDTYHVNRERVHVSGMCLADDRGPMDGFDRREFDDFVDAVYGLQLERGVLPPGTPRGQVAWQIVSQGDRDDDGTIPNPNPNYYALYKINPTDHVPWCTWQNILGAAAVQVLTRPDKSLELNMQLTFADGVESNPARYANMISVLSCVAIGDVLSRRLAAEKAKWLKGLRADMRLPGIITVDSKDPSPAGRAAMALLSFQYNFSNEHFHATLGNFATATSRRFSPDAQAFVDLFIPDIRWKSLT